MLLLSPNYNCYNDFKVKYHLLYQLTKYSLLPDNTEHFSGETFLAFS